MHSTYYRVFIMMALRKALWFTMLSIQHSDSINQLPQQAPGGSIRLPQHPQKPGSPRARKGIRPED